MAGKLIVFEGLDSSGKATQTRLLAEKLRLLGKEFEVIDFPQYGQWSAAFVEHYLNGEFGELGFGSYTISAEQASLFYALDRFACKKKLVEWLNAGKNVIANRYVASNQAYQAAKIQNPAGREKFLKWLDELEYKILGLPRPNIVMYLHMPFAFTQKFIEHRKQKAYIKNGNKDIHEKDAKFLIEVGKVYDFLAKNEEPEKYEMPEKWFVVECAENGAILSPEQVHAKVWVELKKMTI